MWCDIESLLLVRIAAILNEHMLTAMVLIHNKQYKVSDVGVRTVSSLNILSLCLRSLAPSTCICGSVQDYLVLMQ